MDRFYKSFIALLLIGVSLGGGATKAYTHHTETLLVHHQTMTTHIHAQNIKG